MLMRIMPGMFGPWFHSRSKASVPVLNFAASEDVWYLPLDRFGIQLRGGCLNIQVQLSRYRCLGQRPKPG